MEIKKIKLEQNFDHLLFLGDIHGDYHWISYFLHNHDLNNILIYQVGDFQIGFHERQEKSLLNTVNNILSERNSKVVVIRGNHDNPDCFKSDKFRFSNIQFLSDYTILTVMIKNVKKNILGIGGAISIDRLLQIKNDSWFADEPIKYITDLSILNSLKDIHIIVTHTAPDFVSPFKMGSLVEKYSKNDKMLKADLILERQKLSTMIDYLIGINKETLTAYFYGHFHFSSVEEYKNVEFRCLAVNEFKEFLIEEAV